MRITILTLFPEMFDGYLTNSIIKRAISKNLVEVKIVNIRDFTKDKYGRVDSNPIGGSAGLIMKCQPIVDSIKSVENNNSHIIMLSPRGSKYSQQKAHELLKLSKDLILLCGHYEGIDERVNDYVDEQISIGDYILTGGELGAMVISDSIIRLIDGTISNESIIEESFENGLLEYPQYTEPYDFDGKKVPDILYSGNHTAIAKWRKKKSIELTRKYRPDLFNNYQLSKQEYKLLEELNNNIDEPDWQKKAIEKGIKFMKEKEVK